MHELIYEEAVSLFKQWGFEVESAPRPDEVTLILETPDSRTYTVHPRTMLSPMATTILAVRWRHGTAGCWAMETLG